MSELQKNSKLVFFSFSIIVRKNCFSNHRRSETRNGVFMAKDPKDWKQWPINSQKKTIFIFSFFLLTSLHLCQQPLCWPLFRNQKLLLPLQIEWLTRVFLGSCFSNSLCLAPLFSQLDLKQSCCNWISCFSWKKIPEPFKQKRIEKEFWFWIIP